MLEFNGTIIFIAISFILFSFIMQFILYSPMRTVRGERKRYIRNNKRYTSYNNAKKQQVLDKKSARIIKAKKEASEIIHRETQDASAKKFAAVSGAMNDSKQELQSYTSELNSEKKSVKEVLKSEISELACGIASKILGKEVAACEISDEIVESAVNG